jgi:hypothetical protein
MSMDFDDLNAEEQAAVRALRRLEKKWPSSLWLFAASGSLCVMKKKDDGSRGMVSGGGHDAELVVETISIPCDGGDW